MDVCEGIAGFYFRWRGRKGVERRRSKSCELVLQVQQNRNLAHGQRMQNGIPGRIRSREGRDEAMTLLTRDETRGEERSGNKPLGEMCVHEVSRSQASGHVAVGRMEPSRFRQFGAGQEAMPAKKCCIWIPL